MLAVPLGRGNHQLAGRFRRNQYLSLVFAIFLEHMSREEAIVLTSRYLAQLPGHHALALDYTATIQSLTDYAECWYADLHYHCFPEQLPLSGNGGPGFTINKRDHLIRSISWLELYELNCEPLLF